MATKTRKQTNLSRPRPLSLRARLERVRIFLCDVDGVLTDGSVFIGAEQETKRFNIRDGLGLVFLRRVGIKVGWISSRPSLATQLRAAELKIDYLEQTKHGKIPQVEKILAMARLNWEDVCYVGDDVVDLGVMERAGLAVAVGDGIAEVRAAAHYVTKAPGGHGAIREIVEMILKAQNKWDGIVAEYSA